VTITDSKKNLAMLWH